jgi:hypothetical protein
MADTSIAGNDSFPARRTASSKLWSHKKENECNMYGHTIGKVRAGSSSICAVCCKRFCLKIDSVKSSQLGGLV